MKVKKRRVILPIVLLIIAILIIYSLTTKNPEGTALLGEFKNVVNPKFLYDLRYEKDGEKIFEGEIFNEELEFISNAKEFLLVDLFLYNDQYNRENGKYRPQVREMTDKILEKKIANPSMKIYFITDPINNFYGAYEQEELKRLKDGGIEVVVTDHSKMKDSNPIYSGFWRVFIKPFGTGGKGWIRNFFQKDGPKVNIRSILYLLNFKGNHRKVFISESEALVASANPHDPSGLHSNVALRFSGESVLDLLKTEEAILNFHGVELDKPQFNFADSTENSQIRIITDEGIGAALDENIDSLGSGDRAYIGVFYLSDFKVLEKLQQASRRGAEIFIVADLNRDAFGLKKNGSPNRPALTELVDKSENISVRWYSTNGEQYHTKMAYFKREDGSKNILLGSANFTKRNLRGLNFETDVEIKVNGEDEISREVEEYFNRIWNNKDEKYTLDFEEHREDGIILRNLWKIQEKFGLCTW